MLAVMAEPPLLLAFDLTGTFAFALNGAITGLEAAKLDIIGMLTLGMITALGGGILRDILISALPPATFSSWPYLAVAAGGALIAFFLSRATAAIHPGHPAAGRRRAEPVLRHRRDQIPGIRPRPRAGRHPRSRHRRRRRDDPRRPGAAGPDSPHQRPVRHTRPGRRRDRGNGCAYRGLRRPRCSRSRPGLLPDPASGHPLQHRRAHRTRGQEQRVSTPDIPVPAAPKSRLPGRRARAGRRPATR